MTSDQIDFSSLEKALEQLTQATSAEPANDLERDGVIQRFEYTFELAWKAGKRVLKNRGIESLSPKSVIRDLAQQQFIASAELWMKFLVARNHSSHTYQQTTAEEVHEMAKQFPAECRSLLEKFKKEK